MPPKKLKPKLYHCPYCPSGGDYSRNITKHVHHFHREKIQEFHDRYDNRKDELRVRTPTKQEPNDANGQPLGTEEADEQKPNALGPLANLVQNGPAEDDEIKPKANALPKVAGKTKPIVPKKRGRPKSKGGSPKKKKKQIRLEKPKVRNSKPRVVRNSSPPMTRQRLQNLLQPSPPRRGAYISDDEDDLMLEANGFQPIEVVVHEEEQDHLMTDNAMHEEQVLPMTDGDGNIEEDRSNKGLQPLLGAELSLKTSDNGSLELRISLSPRKSNESMLATPKASDNTLIVDVESLDKTLATTQAEHQMETTPSSEESPEKNGNQQPNASEGSLDGNQQQPIEPPGIQSLEPTGLQSLGEIGKQQSANSIGPTGLQSAEENGMQQLNEPPAGLHNFLLPLVQSIVASNNIAAAPKILSIGFNSEIIGMQEPIFTVLMEDGTIKKALKNGLPQETILSFFSTIMGHPIGFL